MKGHSHLIVDLASIDAIGLAAMGDIDEIRHRGPPVLQVGLVEVEAVGLAVLRQLCPPVVDVRRHPVARE